MEQLKPTIKLSRSTMSLHVSSALVFSFTERLNFPVICSRLTGQKTPEAHVSAYVFFAHLVNLFKSDNIDKKCKIKKIIFFKYFF